MTCEDFRAFVARYEPDTTTRADQWVAFRHRETCEPCRLHLARLAAMGRRELSAAQRAAAVASGFRQAVAILRDPESMGGQP